MKMAKIFLPGDVIAAEECNGNVALFTALHFAENGYHVFPIAKGTKKPALSQSWKDISTTDQSIIKGWAKTHPGCNFALDCGKSDVFVIDVDVRDGKPGFASLNALESRFGNLRPTYKVATPSGGMHFYYAEKLPTTASTVLGKGIDTRGAGGYVLLPGSYLAFEKKKYVALNPRHIASLGPKLKEHIQPACSICEFQGTSECDNCHKPMSCTNTRLGGLPPDFGVSKLSDEEVLDFASNDQKFMDLYNGDWNGYESQSHADQGFMAKLAYYCGRDREQMERLFSQSGLVRDKWTDREDYRQGLFMKSLEFGETHPAQQSVVLDFGEEPSVPFYERPPLRGSELAKRKPPEMEWIFSGPGGLPKNIVAFIAGQGGCGKSTLALQIAASIVSGKDCTDGAFSYETKGPVVAVFAEEDEDEMARRISRVKERFDLNDRDLYDLHIYPRGGDPQLIKRDIKGNLSPSAGFQALVARVKKLKPAVVILDSLSVIAGEAEEKNADAAYVVARLSELCDAGDRSTVLILSHVSKASLAGKAERGSSSASKQGMRSALDAVSLRGASALVNNARWIMLLTQVPKKVREEMEVAGATVVAYAVPKTNYSAQLDAHYLVNEDGVLSAVSQFGDDTKEVDYEAMILTVLGEQLLSKTDLINMCAKLESMPTRANVKRLVEHLVATGQLIANKRNKKGGGYELSRPVEVAKEVFQEVSQETIPNLSDLLE